jgi:hypothetical protein
MKSERDWKYQRDETSLVKNILGQFFCVLNSSFKANKIFEKKSCMQIVCKGIKKELTKMIVSS